jgi:hypothetical protein
VKDTCVSFFHMEKLLHNQGLDQDADFDEYSQKFYKHGKVLYGSYWSHIKVFCSNWKSNAYTMKIGNSNFSCISGWLEVQR